MLTQRWRSLPSVLIVGAQRAGTSSLFKYLSGHPDLARGARKEVGFFSHSYDRSEAWYRAHFPLAATLGRRRAFEATPDYLLHPAAPRRAARLLGQVDALVFLRDPAERAFSHYLHLKRIGIETLSFKDALSAEPDRLGPFLESPDSASPADLKRFLAFSYVERGRYGEQLNRWARDFPSAKLHVYFFRDLRTDPATLLKEIESDIGIRRWLPDEFANHSYIDTTVKRSTRTRLASSARERIHQELEADAPLLDAILGAAPPWRA